MRYRVHRSLLRVSRGVEMDLCLGKEVVVVEGEMLEAVANMLGALDVERDLEGAARVAGLDVETASDVTEWLVERGFVVAVGEPLSPRARTLLSKGVTLAGDRVVVQAIARAFADAGIHVVEVGAAGLSIVVAPLLSRTLLDENARARRGGAPLLSVGVYQGAAYLGPIVDDKPGPCARCLSLRVVARRPWTELEVLYRALEPGATLAPPVISEDEAQVIAFRLVHHLRSLEDNPALPIVRVDLLSGDSDAHPLIQHGHCATCAPPLAAGLPDKRTIGAAANATRARWAEILERDIDVLPPTPDAIKRAQDPVTGFLVHAEEWSRREEYFRRLPVVWGGLYLARERENVSTGLRGINGTGPTLEHRRIVAVSEGVERYAQYSHKPFAVGVTRRELGDAAFDPAQLARYEDRQYAAAGFPRPRYHDDHKLKWSWGYGLLSKEARLFPFELINVGITDESYPDRIFDQMLTSGAASHVSYRRALLNALRELIERDALMIAWYKKIPLPRIKITRPVGDAYTDDLLAFLEHHGVALDVFDLRVDFPIPTYLLVATVKETRGSWEKGGVAAVACADLDPIAALSRALCEMAIHFETLGLNPDPAKDWRNWPYDPHDLSQGFAAWWPTYMHYLNPAHRGAFAFLDELGQERELSSLNSYATGDPARDLEGLLALFRERNLEPYAWDLVNDEVAPLAYKVAKCVVPGLIDLTPGMQSRRLITPRLESVPKALGRTSLPEGVINDDPHPNA